jgi:hypothetical protein
MDRPVVSASIATVALQPAFGAYNTIVDYPEDGPVLDFVLLLQQLNKLLQDKAMLLVNDATESSAKNDDNIYGAEVLNEHCEISLTRILTFISVTRFSLSKIQFDLMANACTIKQAKDYLQHAFGDISWLPTIVALAVLGDKANVVVNKRTFHI